jgi:serine phosphatase RsbU (regulator of sigma subunit)
MLFIPILTFISLFSGPIIPVDEPIEDKHTITTDTNEIERYFNRAEITLHDNNDSTSYYYQRALDKTNSLLKNKPKGDNLITIHQKKAKICYRYGLSLYYKNNLKRAGEFFNMALDSYSAVHDSAGMNKSYVLLGLICYAQADYVNALEYYQNSLQIATKLKLKKELSSLYVNLGNLYQTTGKMVEAMQAYQSSIEIKEELNDTKGLLTIYNNVGALHYNRGDFKLAIDYHKKFLSVSKYLSDSNSMAKACNNLGLDYIGIVQNDTAQMYFDQALFIFKKRNDLLNQSISLNNLGELFYNQKQFKTAESYFLKSVNIRINEGNQNTNGYPYVNLANTYLALGNINKAIYYAQQALEIAIQNGSVVIQQNACQALYKAFEQKEDYKKAFEYYKLYLVNRDSVINEQKNTAISLIESRYQNQLQQREIETQKILLEKRNLEIQQSETETSRYRLIRNFFIIGFLIILIVAGIFAHLWLTKVRLSISISEQKEKINEKNNHLQQLNHEILAQNNQIEEQNTILIDQKSKIESVYSRLQESIYYAQNIQHLNFPSSRKLKSWFNDYFVLMQPKDEVGGDFYWAHKHDNEILIAVGDCTGHGVPGGFLSMLAMALLKGIAKNNPIADPASILNLLRDELIDSLNQTKEKFEMTDGVDMSLIKINLKTRELAFAGAKSHILIIDNHAHHLLKGQYDSVGYCPRMKPFENQLLNLEDDCLIYLFTDGYCDQFNPENEKFGRKRFVELCKTNFDKPLATQKEIMYHVFNEWKGNFEQLDDVLVFCFKLV